MPRKRPVAPKSEGESSVRTKPGRQDVPSWPLSWPLGLCDGRLTLCGTVIPTDTETDTLFSANLSRADEIFAAADPVEVSIRSAVAAYNWEASEEEALVERHFQATLLDLYAKGVPGSPTRLLYGVLLAEDGGLWSFIVGAWYLAALPKLLAEMQRRGKQHPEGSLAGALAVVMQDPVCEQAGLRDRPEVANTFEALREVVGMPRSARGPGMLSRDSRELSAEPGMLSVKSRLVQGGSLIELLGQIALTLDHEIDVTDPIRTLADALGGGMDNIPLAITRDIANEAEKVRRWEGRGIGSNHATAASCLEDGIDLRIEVPGDADDSEENGPPSRFGRASKSIRRAPELRADLRPEWLVRLQEVWDDPRVGPVLDEADHLRAEAEQFAPGSKERTKRDRQRQRLRKAAREALRDLLSK